MQDTKKLLKLFTDFAYGQNYSTAFTELLDYFLIPFKIYETHEARTLALGKLHSNTKKEKICLLLQEIGELSEGFQDPIGMLYEIYISKGQHGQFFTPEHVTDFMATITIGENLQPGQTVCDPACGSGRMLLAAAKINRHLQFYGADIDIMCAKMALVNMLLNSLTGEIAHMDSLSNSFYCGYKTGTVLRDGFHYPHYVELAQKEDSYIWNCIHSLAKTSPFSMPFNPMSSGPINGIQGNLFE